MFARGFPVLTNKQGKDRLNFNCASHHVLDCLLGIKRHMLGHDDVAGIAAGRPLSCLPGDEIRTVLPEKMKRNYRRNR